MERIRCICRSRIAEGKGRYVSVGSGWKSHLTICRGKSVGGKGAILFDMAIAVAIVEVVGVGGGVKSVADSDWLG